MNHHWNLIIVQPNLTSYKKIRRALAHLYSIRPTTKLVLFAPLLQFYACRTNCHLKTSLQAIFINGKIIAELHKDRSSLSYPQK